MNGYMFFNGQMTLLRHFSLLGSESAIIMIQCEFWCRMCLYWDAS